eukprot:TRINITY_DN17664_c0_g1_i1.p1 TRINITY_DN17664_c0_g1~~TRINITY_DN17664_c0_g1_i1.p1  ORF type:complete len:291 (+),score=42.14 TRINITY_DN17664_c0_g1_i1:81-953(+)
MTDWVFVAKAWVLENAAILLMATTRDWLVPVPEQMSWWENLVYGTVGSWFTIELGILLHLIISKHIYSDIPYLSKTPFKHEQGMWDTLVSWFWCNCVANGIALLLLIPMIMEQPPDLYEAQKTGAFDMFEFYTQKLVIMRLIVDVLFYAAHRVEHLPFVYWVHKKHHSHTSCHAVATNLNFHFIDILLEGFLPVFVGLQILIGIGYSLSFYEISLLFSYMLWYETGSHVGKEVPTVSYFPPLSIITRPLGLEEHNVLFHDNHHTMNNCNYGITQWCDYLAGSRNVNHAPR